MKQEINRCRLCNSVAKVRTQLGIYSVVCPKCKAFSETFDDWYIDNPDPTTLAINAWNNGNFYDKDSNKYVNGILM
jgi:phage FluMu protein Com